jgi:hypothetical protein
MFIWNNVFGNGWSFVHNKKWIAFKHFQSSLVMGGDCKFFYKLEQKLFLFMFGNELLSKRTSKEGV